MGSVGWPHNTLEPEHAVMLEMPWKTALIVLQASDGSKAQLSGKFLGQ